MIRFALVVAAFLAASVTAQACDQRTVVRETFVPVHRQAVRVVEVPVVQHHAVREVQVIRNTPRREVVRVRSVR